MPEQMSDKKYQVLSCIVCAIAFIVGLILAGV